MAFELLLIITIYALGAWAYLVFVAELTWYPTIPNLFLALQAVYMIGAITVTLENDECDSIWLGQNLVGFLCVIGGAALCKGFCGFRAKAEWNSFTTEPVLLDFHGLRRFGSLWGLAGFSIALLSWYTIATGGNSVLNAINAWTGGEALQDVSADLAAARQSLSVGQDGYWAPGYLKQFRDVILPVVTMLQYCRWRTHRNSLERAVFLGLLLLSVYFILGSGQRMPIFMFLVAFAIVAKSFHPEGIVHSEKPNKVAYLAILAGVAIFVVMSPLLGRLDEQGGLLETTGQGVYALYDRIVLTTPRENFLSRDVWESLEPLNGQEWFKGLASVLPGTQAAFTNELHAYLGGGEEGNSVLNIWTETWLNFGWLGIPPVGLILGYFLQWLHVRYVRAKSRTTSSLILHIYAGCLITLVSSPVDFLTYGPFTLWIISLLFSIANAIENATQRGEPITPMLTKVPAAHSTLRNLGQVSPGTSTALRSGASRPLDRPCDPRRISPGCEESQYRKSKGATA